MKVLTTEVRPLLGRNEGTRPLLFESYEMLIGRGGRRADDQLNRGSRPRGETPRIMWVMLQQFISFAIPLPLLETSLPLGKVIVLHPPAMEVNAPGSGVPRTLQPIFAILVGVYTISFLFWCTDFCFFSCLCINLM